MLAEVAEGSRVIRREVEALKEGAGAAARQLAGLREQVSQLEALAALREQRLERVGRVQAQRRSDPKSVEAITTLMEGGDEAFRKRAAFYDKNSH